MWMSAPWLNPTNEVEAAISVAIATWFLVAFTVTASIASIVVVFSAFRVQKHQFEHEAEEKWKASKQREILAANAIGTAGQRLRDDLVWLRGVPNSSPISVEHKQETLHFEHALLEKFILLENDNIELLRCLIAARASVSAASVALREAVGNKRLAIAELERLSDGFGKISKALHEIGIKVDGTSEAILPLQTYPLADDQLRKR